MMISSLRKIQMTSGDLIKYPYSSLKFKTIQAGPQFVNSLLRSHLHLQGFPQHSAGSVGVQQGAPVVASH